MHSMIWNASTSDLLYHLVFSWSASLEVLVLLCTITSGSISFLHRLYSPPLLFSSLYNIYLDSSRLFSSSDCFLITGLLCRIENAEKDLPGNSHCSSKRHSIAKWHVSEIDRLHQWPQLPIGENCRNVHLKRHTEM